MIVGHLRVVASSMFRAPQLAGWALLGAVRQVFVYRGKNGLAIERAADFPCYNIADGEGGERCANDQHQNGGAL